MQSSQSAQPDFKLLMAIAVYESD